MPTYTFDGDYIDASVDIDNPASNVSIVRDRISDVTNKGNQVLALLIGTDGTGGLIGEMEEALSSAPTTSITAQEVDTSMVLESSGLSIPTFNSSGMVSVPTIDVDFTGAPDVPDEVSVALSWAEATLPTDLYDALKTQILADLVDGSTGITDTVETAIYTRARNRQQATNLSEYNKLNNTIANLQHSLPAGASVALLADFGIGQARQEADLNYGIVEQQAKLAQDNRKDGMAKAVALYQLIVQVRDGESNRNYQSAKDFATLSLQKYSEAMKAVQTFWEGKKAEVQAQVEELKGALDTNKNLVEIFEAETRAFQSAEAGVATRNESGVKLIEARVTAARLDLEAKIATANSLVQAYTAEQSIKERISADRVQACSQVASSLIAGVHAGATLSYSGSESSTKGFNVSVSGSESHSAEHDPTT